MSWLSNFILDMRIQYASWDTQRWKRMHDVTKEYIDKQRNQNQKAGQEIEKQKELNRIKLEGLERKRLEAEKEQQTLIEREREQEALTEMLAALEDVDVEQIPREWKEKLRIALESKQGSDIKEEFIEMLQSHSLHENHYH